MKNATTPSLAHPGVLIATWFGAGLLRPAPGTWGSLAALPFAWAIMQYGDWRWLMGAAALLFPIGIWAANVYAARSGQEDAGPVVVDEVVGLWLTIAIATPLSIGHLGWFSWLLAFVCFRGMDIFKPWPVSWADSRVKGGLGVMLDDVLASLYASGLVIIGEDLFRWML